MIHFPTFPWIGEHLAGFERPNHVNRVLVYLDEHGVDRSLITTAMVKAGVISRSSTARGNLKTRLASTRKQTRSHKSWKNRQRLIDALRAVGRKPQAIAARGVDPDQTAH
jgi:aryl-alcohol dehydrogenase-like predicted oxidoreductase